MELRRSAQSSHKNICMLAHGYNPRAGDAETGGSLGLTGQLVQLLGKIQGIERSCLKQIGFYLKNDTENPSLGSTGTCIDMHKHLHTYMNTHICIHTHQSQIKNNKIKLKNVSKLKETKGTKQIICNLGLKCYLPQTLFFLLNTEAKVIHRILTN